MDKLQQEFNQEFRYTSERSRLRVYDGGGTGG
jgi:hypothetical protein